MGWIYAYHSVYFSNSVEPHRKMLEIRLRRSKPQLLTYYIFHVQVSEAPESEVNLRAEETSPAERRSTDDISAKLGECEMLMDAQPIANLGERCAFILRGHLGVKKDGAFSSANRNSGSRQDAGTQAEESACLQRLQSKSWFHPKTTHKKREKSRVWRRDLFHSCSECCETAENNRKCSLRRPKRFRL